MNETLQQIINACVPIVCMLITAGGAYLVALMRKKTALLEQELGNDTAAKYINMAVDAVDQAVTYVAQTFVDALKSENAFTKERQLEAFDMARKKVLEILSLTACEALDEIYGDFDAWLDTRIEQVCREIKHADTPAVLLLPEVTVQTEAEASVELHEDVKRAMENPLPPTSTPDEWPHPLPEEGAEDAPEEPQSEIE